VKHLSQAFEISRADLLGNIAHREWRAEGGRKRREILLAGRTKFTESWGRDAAFAVPALLALGRHDVVRNTLEAFFDLQHADGRFPRRLSGMSNAERNVRVGLRKWFGVQLSVRRQIRAEFLTSGPRLLWYRGRPKDVNSLLLSATAAYHAASGDASFAAERRPAIERALHWLRGHEVAGLLRQHHFEDWEDHTMHSGHGLYTNVLYHQALRDVAGMAVLWSDEERGALRARAARVRTGLERFWLEEQGHFANFLDDAEGVAAGEQPFSVPGNMLALTTGLASREQRQRIVERLSAVVAEYGYVPICAPGYPLGMTPALRRLFVRHYLTGRLMLPWLQLLAARAVAEERPELARHLVSRVAEPLVRYGRSVEALYDGRTRLRYFFTAPEDHFTWGSAALHEAYAALESLEAIAAPAEAPS
jgi:glycogen debranching enzyme